MFIIYGDGKTVERRVTALNPVLGPHSTFSLTTSFVELNCFFVYLSLGSMSVSSEAYG